MGAVKADHHGSTAAIISKLYCEASEAVLVVRRRPNVVNEGGFVVTNCRQNVVFRVEGCGVVGIKGELVLRDGAGDALLLIRRKGGIVHAMSIYKKWKGYTYDYEGTQKLVFSLKEPNQNSCLMRNNGIRISTEPRRSSKDYWDFQIIGFFPDRDCAIVDHSGNTIAQIGVKKEVMVTKDVYDVVVKAGIDQAFVFGIIAVLDYIYGESTSC